MSRKCVRLVHFVVLNARFQPSSFKTCQCIVDAYDHGTHISRTIHSEQKHSDMLVILIHCDPLFACHMFQEAKKFKIKLNKYNLCSMDGSVLDCASGASATT
jgi:hypothetical protein